MYTVVPIDHAKQAATDALKTASKRAIQKAVEATSDLIGNKIADKLQTPQNVRHRIIQKQVENKN